MIDRKHVPIIVNGEVFTIEQNEFWYLSKLLKNISYYYKTKNNKKKFILLKIPGTGEFRKINYVMY